MENFVIGLLLSIFNVVNKRLPNLGIFFNNKI